MTVHVCAPAPELVKMLRGYCHNCRQNRRFIVAFFAWYDPLETCLRCGERYSGEERLERPFARGWRERSIRSAWRTFFCDYRIDEMAP